MFGAIDSTGPPNLDLFIDNGLLIPCLTAYQLIAIEQAVQVDDFQAKFVSTELLKHQFYQFSNLHKTF
jgi:hypothetical protein